MNKTFVLICIAAGALAAQPRQAQITGQRGDRGKCTIEVVVDGAAEVEIRGDTALLRNLDGRRPEWRRFVCTSPMPLDPRDFHFAGVDGRGRQDLVRDPRGGGPAVVRIEDPQPGSEGYTFDVTWNSGGFPAAVAPPPPAGRGYDDFHRDRDEWFRRDDWRARFFDRVRDDLDHVAEDSFGGRGERYEFDRIHDELRRLQDQAADGGRYDFRLMDDVMDRMREILRDGRISDRDRDVVRDDLNRMREMRERR